MKEKEFESIIILKVQDLVSLILNKDNIEMQEALAFLYQSKLYNALVDEGSKLWHLSTEKLLEMLLIEKETSELHYPDFV